MDVPLAAALYQSLGFIFYQGTSFFTSSPNQHVKYQSIARPENQKPGTG
jgi:hypothetical protein